MAHQHIVPAGIAVVLRLVPAEVLADCREQAQARAERPGFASVGVIDRLIYDNLDPLTALAAAAASTSRIELLSTVVNVCWRNNPVLLAKQLSSIARLAGGRLVAGLGMGGWPADYAASRVSLAGRGARFDTELATMQRAWQAIVGDVDVEAAQRVGGH